MSEYINNTEKRKGLIKDLLKQIHAGTPVEALKNEFSTLLEETNAAEITQVEQMLIEEGMPAEEIQHLCDVHVLLFKETLNESQSPETVPGHPIRNYLLENQAIRSRLEALATLNKQLDSTPTFEKIQVLKQLIQTIATFEKHYARKENILFPYLEKKGFAGPSTVMWGIHDQIRLEWKKALQLIAQNPNTLITSAVELKKANQLFAEKMQEMIYKEEKILFPAAIERLTDEEWLQIAAQEAEIGYCFIQPESTINQETVVKPQTQRVSEGQFSLDTGLFEPSTN